MRDKIIGLKIRPYRTTRMVRYPTDKEGYYQRECPKCWKLFKIHKDSIKPKPLYCPYCRTLNPFTEYATKGQVAEAQKLVQQECANMKNSANSGTRAFVNPRVDDPLIEGEYREIELDTNIQCSKCNGKYIIYGISSVCPFCGKYAGFDVFKNNMDKQYKLAQLEEIENGTDKYVSDMVSSRLRNTLVSFVQEMEIYFKNVESYSKKHGYVQQGTKSIKFQDIAAARKDIVGNYNIDIYSPFSEDEQLFLNIMFQRRHLFAHSGGVVDDSYIKKTGDTSIEIEHIMPISKNDVDALYRHILTLAQYITESFIAKYE